MLGFHGTADGSKKPHVDQIVKQDLPLTRSGPASQPDVAATSHPTSLKDSDNGSMEGINQPAKGMPKDSLPKTTTRYSHTSGPDPIGEKEREKDAKMHNADNASEDGSPIIYNQYDGG